ncbi:transmembrane and ubiquitin-like domain-containing protein 1 isoform X4 [Anticarsia gemmatalis]|uniref:transmembrane and ubiquitin-like domain-containing protein 1 isoform X4 n=1 Tax=Anticarsia gemmatalis TaxID=129554 RepID=UPI003F76EE05
MSLIAGIGDEVVQFVGVVLVGLVAALAWWSTNARPGRYRTVLVMRSRTHHPVTLRIGTRSNLMLSSTPPVATSEGHIAEATAPNNPQSTAESTSDESEVQEESEPASNAQIREMDSIVSAMEADVTAGCDFFTRSNESTTTSSKPAVKKDDKESIPSTANVEKQENTNTGTLENVTESSNDTIEGDRRKILIKLKYLNDTLKEVEGSLDELLKDFKWRHFSSELTAEARVRLIFNGRVLLDDAATLRACGLHDRAVVHCLVHPKRNNNNQQGNSISEGGVNGSHELITERAAPERAWDLENILMTLVSVALTVVWFFRCEYSNMFTASASVALFGLTVFYSVAIFGLYLSDTFQFDRRAPQPVPNN